MGQILSRRRLRRLALCISAAGALAVGSCGLNAQDQAQFNLDLQRSGAIIAGSLAANAFGFILNNALFRAGY